MDSFIPLQQTLSLFAVLTIGFAARKAGMLDEHAGKNLTTVCVDLMLPCSIFQAMQFQLTKDLLMESLTLVLVSAFIFACAALIALIFNRFTPNDTATKNVYYFSILFSNFGLMGIPLIQGLFGDKGLFYMAIFILVPRILFNTLGIVIMQRGTSYRQKNFFSVLTNPPILAVFIGLAFSLLSLKLPSVANTTVGFLARGTTPLGMMIVGINISGQPLGNMVRTVGGWAVSGIRLLIVPLLTLFTLRAAGVALLPAQVAMVCMALPCPAFASVLAKRFGGNDYLGAQVVFISTTCSVVTIPLLVMFSGFLYS